MHQGAELDYCRSGLWKAIHCPGVKVTKKNFGRARRYPIANRFRDLS
jgi:hypothetical protein